MVITVNFVLMLLAFILLVLAAIGVPSQRVNLGWAGMAFWAAALLIH